MSGVFYELGAYGPLILIIISWILLWDNPNMFFYYNIGVFVDAIVNLILKGIVQQPRPLEDLRAFDLALKHGKRFVFKNGTPFDIFGMPSGHAQSVIFSTTFIYLVLKKQNILYLYGLISAITMAQRLTFKFHTGLQVFVGSIVGFLLGKFIYYLSDQKITGSITPRYDDYGPI